LFDLADVRNNLLDLVDESDPRIRAWDEICRQFGPQA
jgi:hypothetical protein